MNILLFEDNTDHIDLFQSHLEMSSFQASTVTVVSSMAHGLELLHTGEYDIIFLDLTLDDSDTVQTMNRISDLATHCPVIVLTSFNDRQTILDVIKRGAEDCLPKIELNSGSLERSIQYATDRVSAKRQLRESEEKYRSLVNNIPVVVFRCTIDASWTMHFISKEIQNISGFPPEDFLNNSKRSYASIIHPDDRERIELQIQDSINQKKAYTIQYRIIGKDQRVYWVYEKGQAIESPNGEHWMDGTIVDITEKMELEAKLREINQNLEERIKEEVKKRESQERLLLQQSKMAEMGNMVAAVAHQWKQPLTVISLTAENLAEAFHSDELTQEEMEKGESIIVRQVQYMTHTVETFRKFLKPSSTRHIFDLNQSVKDIVDLMSIQFEKAGIEVTVSGSQAFAFGYDNEFKQVLLNLLNNSRDILLEKKVEHPRILIRLATNRKKTHLYFSDNGGGVMEDLLPDVLFEPYVTTKGEEGTGIGLSITKRIIEENMDGTIRCENFKGGAMFTIELPPGETPVDSELNPSIR